MPLPKSSSEKAFKASIIEMRNSGYPEKQAVAAAYSNQRRMKAKGLAKGGFLASAPVPGSPVSPGGGLTGGAMGGNIPTHMGGLFQGLGTGRSDSIPVKVPKGSYVMPADVVSGIGHGSSLAGARALDHTYPSHANEPIGRSRVRGFAPFFPHEFHNAFPVGKFAHGGDTDDGDGLTTIKASDGEYLIHPQAIILRHGNLKKGHDFLDKYVVHRRQKIIQEMRNLKPPRKN